MRDTIYREDAIKALRCEYPTMPMFKSLREEWAIKTEGFRKAEEVIMSIPSADRPQGEWIESFKRVGVKQGAYLGVRFIHDGWSCSECSEVAEKRYPNCPYCLARMKGADDE